MQSNHRVRPGSQVCKTILLSAVFALAGVAAHAGSPLTLAIMQDASVKATVLDITYVRNVECKKPGFPPDIKIVKEEGTLKLAGQKTFYISEFRLVGAKQEICFMPAYTIETTTGEDTHETQNVPAETWEQLSQTLDVKTMSALIGSVRVQIGASCLVGRALDTDKNQKVLTLNQTGSATKKPGTSGKLGSTPEKVSIDCLVTPQP